VKILRYRKPSLWTLLGLTRAKRRLRRPINRVLYPYRYPKYLKMRLKSRLGYYSLPMRIWRNGWASMLGFKR